MTPEQQRAMAMANARRRMAEANSQAPQSTPQEAAPNPTDGMSTGQLAAAGAGKFMSDTAIGAQQAQAEGAGVVRDVVEGDALDMFKIPGTDIPIGPGLIKYAPSLQIANFIASKLGINDPKYIADLQAQVDEIKQRDAPLMDTAAGKGGYLGGAITTGLATPGGVGVVGRGLVGATMGGTQPVASDESRGANMAVGAVAGAALPPVIGYAGRKVAEGAAKVAPKATAAIGEAAGKAGQSYREVIDSINDRVVRAAMGAKDKLSPTVAPQVTAAADELLQTTQKGAQAAGVNWGEVDDVLKASMLKQVRDAAELGSDLPPEALIRKAVYESQGISPTRAMITRDFADNLNEQNLMKSEEGGILRDIYTKNNAAIRENIRRVAPAGVQAADAPTYGARLRAPVEAKERLAQDATNQIYKVADLLEGGRTVKPTELVGYLRQNTDMLNASDAGKQVTAYLQKSGILGKGGQPRMEYKLDPLMGGRREAPDLTLRQVSGLRKVVNDAWGSAQGPAKAQLNEMRQLLNGMVDEAGGDMFKAYNQLRTAKGRAFEDNPIIDKLLSDKKGYYGTDFIEDSEVFNKAILKSSPEQLIKLYQHVDKAGKDLTKAQLAKHIEDQVFGNMGTNESGDVVASAAKLNRAISSIGMPKLRLLLGDEDAQGLMLLSKTLREISNPPSGTVPQGSAPRLVFMQKQILNALRRVGKLPVIGDIAEAGLAAAEKGAAAKAAREGVQAAVDPLKPFRDEVAKRAKQTAAEVAQRRLARVGTAAAAGAVATNRDQSR